MPCNQCANLKTPYTQPAVCRVCHPFFCRRSFWNAFRKGAPFTWTGSIDDAYAQLDAYYGQLCDMERETAALHNTEEVRGDMRARC